MEQVRYAVVGAGWISQEAFMPSIPQTGNSVMTAIVTGNVDVRRQLAEFYGIEHACGYDGYDALVASDTIDAVYVALPNSMHADFAIRAMRAGKHALVEKPLAVTVAECEAMIAAARDNGVHLMTAYRLHCEPMTVAALDRIRAGDIGDPVYFSSTFGFQSPETNHRLKAEHWGGPLQDIGVYCLNAARQVFEDEPVEVHALTSHGDGDRRFAEVEGSIAVTMRFPRDRLAQFFASFGSGETDTYRVVGTEGVMEVDRGYRFETTPDVRIIRGEKVERLDAVDTDHFGSQAAYFSDCIRTGQPPEADGAEGLADVRVMRAIEDAARTGLPQTVASPSRERRPGPGTVRIVPRTERRLVF